MREEMRGNLLCKPTHLILMGIWMMEEVILPKIEDFSAFFGDFFEKFLHVHSVKSAVVEEL